MISDVVDRNELGGLNDGNFDGFHGLLVLFLPDEGGSFASEIDKQVSKS